jgi:hypothetical protein
MQVAKKMKKKLTNRDKMPWSRLVVKTKDLFLLPVILTKTKDEYF